ncbi:MAG: ABC transporter ATP-binding protein [Candidatus Eiseniibacteriota bacterium]
MRSYLARHRGALAAAALTTLVSGVAELLKPWPLKLALDLFLFPGDHSHRLGPFAFLRAWPEPVALGALAGLVILIAVMGGLAAYAQAMRLARVGQQVALDLRRRLFTHLERLSLAFHHRRHSGELLVHLLGDVNVLNDFLVSQSNLIVGRVALVVGMIAVMAWMDPLLTGGALMFLPVLAVAVRRHVRAIREATRNQRRREGRIAAVAGESLQLIQVVQAFGAEERQAGRLDREGREFLAAGLRSSRAEALIQRAVELVAALGMGLVLYLGILRVRSGALSPGDLVVFVSYLRTLQRPLRDLAQSAQRYAKASACARRVTHLLATPIDIVDLPGARPAPRLEGEITFQGVSFSYLPHRPALQDVSLRIEPGERVAVVGETGAGKSTLFALVGRFYDPTAGVVRVDGRDVREFTLASLREQIALVMQNPALFGTTIRENLIYGRPDAGEAALWAVLREAQAEEFVRDLPAGLDTELGERGSTLSGGQRQRLAVARALLRDAPLLLLDEPSSGLDASTDRLLRIAIARLTRGRTSLVIAHRLETVTAADRILVLDRGRLVGNGRHEALLACCDAYQRLWEARAWSEPLGLA